MSPTHAPSSPMSTASPPTNPVAAEPPGQSVQWTDPARAAAFATWLGQCAQTHGAAPASLRVASADASFRRYLRVDTTAGPSLIVMDAPPDKEDCRPFKRVADLMIDAGLLAPRVLAWDEPQGFMLLDDLGHQTMMDVVVPERPQDNLALYQRAVDALITWQLASRPGVLPPYDAALLSRELALFPDWYLTQHRGVTLDDAQRATLERTFALIVSRNLASPHVYVHRDFMPRNLMMPRDAAEPRLGVLDFQDAVYGPITYDIASLMRDAFLSWDEDFVLDVTVRYWQQARKAGLPVGDDFGEFYRAVEWMGLQRHLKVAGIFARLTLRDGKPKYLADAPRFIHYIRATASRYIELKPLLRLVDQIEGTAAPTGFAFGRV
jgi:aminoglycoside/choline kinase family phosphotransferase